MVTDLKVREEEAEVQQEEIEERRRRKQLTSQQRQLNQLNDLFVNLSLMIIYFEYS